MIKQFFLQVHGFDLYSMWRWPKKEINAIVILIAGFSHSACDKDYFMSNLSQKLNENNLLTIQFDLYGHGDSDGNIAELTSHIVREELLGLIGFLQSYSNLKELPIKIITRGVIGICIAHFFFDLGINELLVIAPPVFSKELRKIIVEDFQVNYNLKCKEYIHKDTYITIEEKRILFEILGAYPSNLLGQNVPYKFLIENISTELVTTKEIAWICFCGNGYKSVNDFHHIPIINRLDDKNIIFVRDPLEYYLLIKQLSNIVSEI